MHEVCFSKNFDGTFDMHDYLNLKSDLWNYINIVELSLGFVFHVLER